MKKYLLVSLCISCFMGSAYAQTDAVLISIKPSIPSDGINATNTVTTGITIENGDFWVWGFRNSGQQGNGKTSMVASTTPARVTTFVQQGRSIIQAAAGAYHLIALDDQGDVWSWGQNLYGEAGGKVCNGTYINTPCKILANKNVIQIAVGEYISFALTKSGDVYSWGRNRYGQQATGDRNDSGLYMIPREYFNNQSIVQIGSAYEGGYAINTTGEVFGWGREYYDSFGYPLGMILANNDVYNLRPKKLNIANYVNGNDIEYICGGHRFTNYLKSDGTVWGMGGFEKLGIGHPADKIAIKYKTATPVKIISDVDTLYCRYAGSLAITNNGQIYTWGGNENKLDPYHIYGESPVIRNYNPNLTKVDGGKDHVTYWTDKGKGYGIGFGGDYKFNTTNYPTTFDWPGQELSFVINAMKAVYGADYIVGQGN